MPAVTIRNLSAETHRALKERAAHHGRSMEAEIRDILEAAVRPANRLRLGTALAEMSRKIGLTNTDVEALEQPGAPRPLNRCASNDPARHECRLGGHGARHRHACPQRAQGQADRAVNGLLELSEDSPSPSITAARCYADLAIKARAAGRGFPTPDGYAAAIAGSCELAVASRDTCALAAAAVP